MRVLIIILLMFSTSVFAKDKGRHNHKDDHTHDISARAIGKDKVLVKVKGMVCAFCAQGIEKNFNKRKEVLSTKVDLDKMEVLITYKKDQSLSQDDIQKIVTSAGFSFVGMK